MRKKDNFKIAIIGPYPPPYGGISIHVQRMHYFMKARSIKHTVYTKIDTTEVDLVDMGKEKGWPLKYFFTAKEDILHFHNIDWRERILIGLMGFLNKKVVSTIHGSSLNDQINQGRWLKKKILMWALKNIYKIIVVNSEIKSLLVSLGVRPEKVECIPAFIPPIATSGRFVALFIFLIKSVPTGGIAPTFVVVKNTGPTPM